jgi:DMSO/TMAO reductase YedYZ molybdopterin-dependent catalytic subunit
VVRQPRSRLTDRLAGFLHRPLPAPPRRLRRGPWRANAFRSPLRSPRLTSYLGIGLAVAFTTAFVTGLISHLIQHPPGWFDWPSHPAGLYRVTQSLHVATGLATIPLLAAKLWSVYPRLYHWPPARDLAHAIERGSIAVLVAAALFQLVTGVLNIALWYNPMPFFFTAAHYWTAWLAIGAIMTHIGVKLPVIRQALTQGAPPSPRDGMLTRRGLLGAVAAAAGVVTLTTVGQTVAPLVPVSVLAPRRPRTGAQQLPVNKSAKAAGVVDRINDVAYRLTVAGPARKLQLSLADLAALPQRTVTLPIQCVEGWSADGVWTGVRLRDLADLVGADPERAEATIESLQEVSRYRVSMVPPQLLRDPLTLLSLRLHGEPLHLDHGYPCRLIAPNRPGVLQTKWVGQITFGGAP